MKKIQYLILLIVAVFASGCNTAYIPPQKYNVDNKKTIQQAYETTWNNIVAFCNDNGYQIKTMDKASGFITIEKEFIKEDTNKECDCGVPPVLGEIRKIKFATNITVSAKSNDITDVTINTYPTAILGTATSIKCESKGYFETELFKSIGD